MGDSNLDIEGIIYDIQSLRWNILPSYTYNNDEEERQPEEYIDYYSKNIDQCIEALDLYTKSVQGLAESPESETVFRDFLQAREVFINTFPFCYDELEEADLQDIPQLMKYMIPRSQSGQPISIGTESLLKYKNLLQQLIPYLKPDD